ncbi:MAG: patatin family protein [Lachnospiraceae bacterium]|nr:patatin family protein [Lachnospiraceae bacterium]
MKKGTLILEGGAVRGVFTSGVLDYLMERNLYLSYVVGVSAGTCNGVNYVAKQIERTKKCMIHQEDEYDYYMGIRRFIKEKSLLNMDMIFDKFPNEIFPFDYDTYFDSEIATEWVTTNCITGKAEYMDDRENKERLMKICRASSSMPLISPIVNIDGVPYLDGGLSDSIPIRRAMKYGNKKMVIVLTKNKGYRKKFVTKARRRLYVSAYKKYPELVKTLIKRPVMYNRTLEKIEKLEDEGKIFVIRPETMMISRLERNVEKQEEFYRHGYEQMEKKYDELVKYLG